MKELLIAAIGVIAYVTVGYIVLVLLAALLGEPLDVEDDEVELGFLILFWPFMAILLVMIIVTRIGKYLGQRVIALAVVLKALMSTERKEE